MQQPPQWNKKISQETRALVLFHHYLGDLKIPEYHFPPIENDTFGLFYTILKVSSTPEIAWFYFLYPLAFLFTL